MVVTRNLFGVLEVCRIADDMAIIAPGSVICRSWRFTGFATLIAVI